MRERALTGAVFTLAGVCALGFSGCGKKTAHASRPEVAFPQPTRANANDNNNRADRLSNNLASPTATAKPEPPILRIEAGMHIAPIGKISTDAAGRLVLTVSTDKTARLWELPSGRLLNVLRPSIGTGDLGKLYAGDLSPDGSLAVLGGILTGKRNEEGIYFFDTASGRLLYRLTDLPSTTRDLRFSGSGRFLAAGFSSGGIRIWEVSTHREIARDSAYPGTVNNIHWFKDERLVTSCRDGKIRLYDAEKALLGASQTTPSAQSAVICPTATRSLADAKEPAGVRFSPDGSKIAVGFRNTARVVIIDGRTIEPRDSVLSTPEQFGDSFFNLASVAWSADGNSLAAGGTWQWAATGQYPVRRWSDGGMGSFEDTAISNDAICDLLVLPDGAILYAAADPEWGMVSPEGEHRTLGSLVTSIFNNTTKGLFHLSADGTILATETVFERGAKPACLRLTERRWELLPPYSGAPVRVVHQEPFRTWDSSELPPPSAPVGLRPAKTDGLEIENWDTSIYDVDSDGVYFRGRNWIQAPAPTLNGLKLLQADEVPRSLAIAADKRFFVLGTDQFLRRFDADGVERWRFAAPDMTWAVNLSADGALAVAAYGDGSIRWHRTDDGRELLAFFPHADGRHWVLWTPEGYYDCSPGGEDLIGWHVNRGPDKAADFFPASRFRDTYYRPDVIDRVLETRDVAEALRLANEAAGKKSSAIAETAKTIEQRQPPVVELTVGGAEKKLFLDQGATVASIRYKVRRNRAEPVTGVRVQVDGRPALVEGKIPTDDDSEVSVVVPVPARECIVSIIAENRAATSEAAAVHVIPQLPEQREEASTQKRRLVVLSVGVNAHLNNAKEMDRPWNKNDAEDLVATLRKQAPGLYRDVQWRVLTGAEASAGNILDGFDWLRRESKPDDVTIILLMGHGGNDERKRFFFTPYDFDEGRQARTSVSYEEIQRCLSSLPGRVILFVGSCHSGDVLGGRTSERPAVMDTTQLTNALASEENGVVVFTASTGRQVAWSGGKLRNSIFFQAVLEGLNGKADLLRNGTITVASLETYISSRVPELFQTYIASGESAKRSEPRPRLPP